jgi:hypothetical protein
MMETFVIGYLPSDKQAVWAFVNTSSSVVKREFVSYEGFQAAHPYATLGTGRNYRAGGYDQLTISVEGLSNIQRLLEDRKLQMASATLNLALMRMGPTIYWAAAGFKDTELGV